MKWSVYGLLDKLQRRYPFSFASALRGLESEVNRQIQERLATHLLWGAVAELSDLDAAVKDDAWALGGILSKQIGRGGENFYPREFTPEEKALAEKVGHDNLQALFQAAEKLSVAMKFKLGPVNATEHVLSWSFRYLGQLIKAALWESLPHEG